MKVNVMQSSDLDKHIVISFFNEKGSGFGLALTNDKTPKMIERELNERLRWLEYN
jgi:hypothetical protein